MNNYKELKVWKIAMELTMDVYAVAKKFPEDEKFGLKSQIQRSAVSVPSNIAEGAGRGSKKEFSNFLSISLSSSYELETQLILSHNLNFVARAEFESIIGKIDQVQKMIFGLKKALALEPLQTTKMN